MTPAAQTILEFSQRLKSEYWQTLLAIVLFIGMLVVSVMEAR